MKLEKFKEKNNKQIGIIIFTVCCILLITGVYLYSSFAIYEQDQNFNVINGTVEDPGDLYFAFYVDDVISKTMPAKDSGYVLDTEKSSCTNGATPVLNEDWSVSVNNLTVTNTKCTLYFVKGIVGQIIDQLDKTGACPNVNDDGTVEVTAAESENGYLCSALDDYGTSYYYRGNVINNYVYFAGYYWRIIRINGDGSIRIIYDGTSAHSNTEASEDRTIGESRFNEEIMNEEGFISPVGVGYMYGDSYRENALSSTIKSYIDNWYESVFLNTEYENYLADTLFCDDRTLLEGDGVNPLTDHRYRWYYGPWSTDGINYPVLKCSNKADAFTVNESENRNGNLIYPIGLITLDEAVLAGAYERSIGTDGTIRSHYLYAGYHYWSLSASYSTSGGGALRVISNLGNITEVGNGGIGNATGVLYVRPVINLKPNSLKSGDGTMTSPYRTEL